MMEICFAGTAELRFLLDILQKRSFILWSQLPSYLRLPQASSLHWQSDPTLLMIRNRQLKSSQILTAPKILKRIPIQAKRRMRPEAAIPRTIRTAAIMQTALNLSILLPSIPRAMLITPHPWIHPNTLFILPKYQNLISGTQRSSIIM